MFQWPTQWSPFEAQYAKDCQLIKIKSIIIIIIIIIINPITPISAKEKTNKNIQISFL